MKYSSVAGLDIKLSRLGFGCWQLGGHGWGRVSETEIIRAAHRAIDFGINLFDTAPIYGLGHSEELLGKILGVKRKDIVLATKVGLVWEKGAVFEKFTDISPANIQRELDASLKRLNTDYIDIYQIHWPDTSIPLEEPMYALEKLRGAGKIRHIGCCNFSLGLLKEALRYGRVAAVQVSYNLVDREVESDLMSFCRENDIAIIAYNPLARGLLSGKYNGSASFGDDDNRSRHRYFQGEEFQKNLQVVERVKAAAGRINRSAAQVAIRWVLKNPCVSTALVGVKTAAQLEENLAAVDFELPGDEMELLNE